MKLNALGLATALFCAALPALPTHGQFGLDSDFTYQGKLELAGEAINGFADFQFRLFNSPSGGAQVGSTFTTSEVNVIDGVFTVPVDFGMGAFNGEARWLEIGVRFPADQGSFIILTPRQPLTATPYAVFSAKPWGTNGTSTFYSTGNVGIGTSNPQGPLDVRSANSSYVRVDSQNGDLHMNGGSDGVAGIFNDTTNANARLDFVVNGAAHMVVNGQGQVGVGTTTLPQFRRFTARTPEIFTGRFESTHPIASIIELANTNGGTWEWGVAGNAPPSGTLPGAMYLYKQGEVDLALAISPNQWIGMGVNNPSFRLDLPNIGNEDGRGRANAWVTYSSKRWKENVETISGALDTIKQLRGVEFDWKKDHGGKHDIGFVAEEVGKIVPEIVTWERDGVFAQGMAYDRITALAVEAIKEQQAQIDGLLQANAELRAQIERLMELLPARDGQTH